MKIIEENNYVRLGYINSYIRRPNLILNNTKLNDEHPNNEKIYMR